MSWIGIAIISHVLFAIVFALDKVLIKKYVSPLRYAALIGILEGLAFVFVPFVDIQAPSLVVLSLSLLSGIAFITGLYTYFRALEDEETSWAAPLLFGVLVPLASLGINYYLLTERLHGSQLISFLLLVLGGYILSFRGRFSSRALGFLILSSIVLSLDYALLKVIFDHVNFISGYIFSRVGGAVVGGTVFLVARAIQNKKENSVSDNSSFGFGPLLAVKQVLSFMANILFLYAISLTSPTLLNASNGVRYLVLLPLTLVLGRIWPNLLEERITVRSLVQKIIALFLISVGLIGVSVTPFRGTVETWGVTYSTLYAQQFGFDSKEVFTRIVDELGVREVRLVAYWPQIEPEKGIYDFTELDFELETLRRVGGRAVITLGIRLPRWPECHLPSWATYGDLDTHERALGYIEQVIMRYRDNPVIWAWQIENEPFLFGFGECPPPDADFLDEEIARVKALDDRPVIMTDSGELGRWYRAYTRGDIFGTTMYRTIWNEYIPGGYFTYPLPPGFFSFKAGLMEGLFGKKEILGIELQAEPWTHRRPWDTSLKEQLQVFSLGDFQDNIHYARNVGFSKNYLWGVEWWFWMKETQNHPEYWEYAKMLFK